MAFDQNSIPKDWAVNTARPMPEDTRIAPVTTSGRGIEGYYVNQPRDVGTPGIYYPATVSESGFVGIGYSNLVPGAACWGLRTPTSSVSPPPAILTAGYGQNLNYGTRVSGNASDQASDEGGEDSVSGKKVKFLCSFGGKILPRPSDGMLRYVGGQTRIISVRRDVSFNELVQKMIDTYGQNVVIKYQLPDEDLDALVSVSCPDDLENMMDEYEKLVERSSDGLVKLRVFLFLPSEIDSSTMVHFGELQDSGQRYVEAINGMRDGVVGAITRKDSIASAASTQNSDLSATEAIDSSGICQLDLTGTPSVGIISPTANSASSQEPASRLLCVDTSPAIYAEASNAPLSIPVVLSGPSQTLSSRPEHALERSAPLTVQQQHAGVNFQPPPSYFQAYVDPHQEALNRGDYVNAQMGFPPPIMGTVGPMFTHPPFQDNVAGVPSHQFVPAGHVTMTPSNVNMKPNLVPLVQAQHIGLDFPPDQSTFGARVFQVPGSQTYSPYQAQVAPAVVGGGYGWNKVPQPEVVLSEGFVPHQQVMLHEKIQRFKDCYMCEKALPHAHSDTVVQDHRESPSSNVSDFNPLYHSLQLEDKINSLPMNIAVVTGAVAEGIVEQQGSVARPIILNHIDHEGAKAQSAAAEASQNVARQYEDNRITIQKTENPGRPIVSVPQGVSGMTIGLQSPYVTGMPTHSQLCQENTVQQLATPSHQTVRQESLVNKPINSDIHPGVSMPFQMPDQVVHEYPTDYSSTHPGIISKEDIEGRMENLRISPSDIYVNSKQSKSPGDSPLKEDILDARSQQIVGGEPYLENNFAKSRVVSDMNHITKVLPSLNEVSYVPNFQPQELCEAAQPPLLGNPDEGSYGNPAFSGVDFGLTSEIMTHAVELKDLSREQPKVLPADASTVISGATMPFSLSPSNRVGDMHDTSNSLFSNLDPWKSRYDSQFPPPKPNKIATRKEGFGTRDAFGENHLGNSGELPKGNNGELTAEMQLEDGVSTGNAKMDSGSDHGSAEELIKQELQAVAEGVAASVLYSSTSNPSIILQERTETLSECSQNLKSQTNDVELHKANYEDVSAKIPEKTNLGFPVSDELGRLQIIKNIDLEELQELGSGTFGTVYHGKWRGTDVAIKRINDRCFAGKPSEQERMRDDFWNEAIKLADLHHPNVVAFYGVVLDGPGGSVATVTEYMVNGSLRNALQKNERSLDKRKRLIIALDVAFGMEYLHGKNIVHFDLKSDNLLVNLRDPHRPICKVGDLGLSKVKCQTLISGGVRGTLPWMAPELLNGSSSLVSEKVDVFSFGIVMWELLTGEEPYGDLHYGAIIGGIVSNTLRPPVPEPCDPEWRSLMERCWSAEPSERPSFTEIANELRTMASKLQTKAQAQQQAPLAQTQAKG
ncbi:uncharacterized protein LOC127795023 isoform X2 [Diospyros lotus]|uniref:uncharacterized protein LOC127795023 isoform X2 n=1 Tax=Diospyros lotus TaxID=55363 RepID=UPI0022505D58|nr:uncharacterized protein LOC127795023 isoform X2 [Diospyros lotus]